MDQPGPDAPQLDPQEQQQPEACYTMQREDEPILRAATHQADNAARGHPYSVISGAQAIHRYQSISLHEPLSTLTNYSRECEESSSCAFVTQGVYSWGASHWVTSSRASRYPRR